MPYARLVELLECSQLEERREDLRAALSGGMLEFHKYQEFGRKLTRAKVELDEAALEHVGDEAERLLREGKMRKLDL